ncbi:unnamed protein product, partial [Prorocentrum cordatum]
AAAQVRATGWRGPAQAQQAFDAWTSGLISKTDGLVSNVGCRNYASIQTGSLVIVESAQKCADHCHKREGCVEFNWQKKGGSRKNGNMMIHGHTFGTCLTYKQPCDRYPSGKWDLYAITPAPAAPAPAAPAPATPAPATPAPATPAPATPAPATPAPATPAPATPAPATPAPATGEGPRYCPSADDLQSFEEGPTLQQQGWIIEGDGRVGTRAAFDLNGGSIQFKVLLEGVPSGLVGGQLVSALVGLIMPEGSGDVVLSEEYCDGRPDNFCPDVNLIQTNGRSAYSVSLRTGSDEQAECYYAEADGELCVAERFFQSDISCGVAPDAVIDATKAFYVSVSFPSSDSKTELVVTLTQGEVEETIRFADLTDGTVGPPFLVSQNILYFSMETYGAVPVSSLKGVHWAPKKDACPDGDTSWDGARLQVSDLVIQGEVVGWRIRGHCTLCEDVDP